MTSIGAKPLVFISASHRDNSWRDRIKAKLETHVQTELWDDSQIEPGNKWNEEIGKAIDRARVAVVLLSPDYLASETATSELRQLAQRAESGRLRLFPIVVRDCRWQDVPELRIVQVWSMGRPLEGLGDVAVEIELEKIAADITALALETAARTGAQEPSVLRGASDPEFRFSKSTDAVLKRALLLVQRSRRAGVTSSCLLFALAESAGEQRDTARFVRDAIDRAGGYDAAFATFLKDSGNSLRQSASEAGQLGRVSNNVRALLESAATFAVLTSNKRREIHQRHLFAALLVAPGRDGQPNARNRMQALGLDVPTLCREFRDFIRSNASGDDAEAWDVILLSPTVAPELTSDSKPAPGPASGSAQQLPSHSTQPLSNPPNGGGQSAVDGYTSGPAGYTSEFCGVGGSRAVADHLGVEPMAHRLAELIALRETKLPLAIGLFGDWGSGKSHFMNLMDRHMKNVARETPAEWARRVAEPSGVGLPDRADEGSWCREIVPIYFNAWHYLDANLWASLVTEIFDGLFRHLQPKQDALALVRSQLRDAGGAAALAEEEVVHARAAVRTASTALQEARARSEGARQAVQGLLDNLRTLLPQVTAIRTRERVEDWLGVSAEVATLSQLVEKHRDMASLAGRLHELWRRMTVRTGLWWRLGWLMGLLVVAPLVVRFAAESVPFLKDLLGQVGPSLQRTLGWMIGGITWLAPALVKIQRRLGQMESLQQQAEEAQAARSEDQIVIDAQQRVVQAEVAAAAAEAALATANTLEQQLTQAVDELRPERRLSRFIEARARSADYRGQLGLVSLARRDFQELSDIFADEEALQRKMDVLPEDKARELAKLGASIDRIVLFVDDLDRCQPEKVVDVLQAVHLLLAYPLFAVVVGVDQRCLRQSLRMQFRGLLTEEHPDPEASGPALSSDADERPATPLDYLEKIFHIPFHLPSMDERGYAMLMENLTKPLPQPAILIGGPDHEPKSSTLGSAAEGTEISDAPTPFAEELPMPGAASASIGAAASAGATLSLEVGATSTRTIGSVPLQQWERTAIKAYYPLVRTPRGAIRLLNTYRLVRAGIPAEDWATFRGDGATYGEFRIAMLLLASAAGYPAVAREWFKVLRTAEPNDVLRSGEVDSDSLAWLQFKEVYSATFEQITPGPTKASLVKWIDRVEQFAF